MKGKQYEMLHEDLYQGRFNLPDKHCSFGAIGTDGRRRG